MRKHLLYKLFGIGKFPPKLLPDLELEIIKFFDEGISGVMSAKNLNGSIKRYSNKKQWFLGSIVITKSRLIFYTFSKRQINIATNDPMFSKIVIGNPKDDSLVLSFDYGLFNNEWSGEMEFRIKTEKASEMFQYLLSVGAGKVI